MDPKEIHYKLKQCKSYWELKKKVLNTFKKDENYTLQDIQRLAQSSEIEQQLKKLISNYIKKSKKREPIKQDELEFINVAKAKWTDLLFKNLEVVYQMSKQQEEDETNKGIFIYDERNLLQFLSSYKSPNPNHNRLVQMNIPFNNTHQLFDKYRYLTQQEEMTDEKIYKIRKQIENEQIESELEKICCHFLPIGERTNLYLKYFELENQDAALQQQFNKLQKETLNQFFDELIESDTNEIAEDSFYFVFSDQIMLCLKSLMRDKSIKEHIAIYLHNLKSNQEMPLCGFLPFKNLAKYVAPFCYISTKTHIIYYLFREFFCRYLSFLHSISSHQNSIVSIALKIEEAVTHQSPKLYMHLKQIGCDSLKIIFHEILYCFIGTLEPQEILLIYDQIIGHNSLDILVILACGVLSKYKSSLLLSKNQQEIDEIFQALRDDKFTELVNQAYL